MLRVGVLGAARITAQALIEPALDVEGVEVVAIAARDRERAVEAAARSGIARVVDDYEAMLADPEIEAIYIPLPNALHGKWTMAAIAAGKHVLCEKPFAANADEARVVAAAAKSSGVVVMEAHHTSHHPQTQRAAELVHSGILGTIVSVDSSFNVPMPPAGDIRWDAGLAGGALMDLGCYPVRWLRDVMGVVPSVSSAIAVIQEGVDASANAFLDYEGIPGEIHASMSSDVSELVSHVRGSAGLMTVRMPFHPHLGGSISIDGPDLRVHELADPHPSYTFQLEAFRNAVEGGGSNVTNAEAALETLVTIDAIYAAAGISPRQSAKLA